MGSLIHFLRQAPPSRLGPFHGRGGPSGCSRGRLEATAAVLTGAASIWTTERLLRMWSGHFEGCGHGCFGQRGHTPALVFRRGGRLTFSARTRTGALGS